MSTKHSLRSLPTIFMLAVSLILGSFSANAQILTCGGHDPAKAGKIKVDEFKDSANNIIKFFCVDDIYFQGEVCRADGINYPFGKCVFDAGRNKWVITKDAAGKFTKLCFFNVDGAGGGVTLDDLCPLPLETPADQEARLRKLILDKKVSGNIYCTTFSPGDQIIEGFASGVFGQNLLLSPTEAISAYDSSSSQLLTLDPNMLTPPNLYQEYLMVVPETSSVMALSLGGTLFGVLMLRRKRTLFSSIKFSSPKKNLTPSALVLLILFLPSIVSADTLTIDFASGRPPTSIAEISELTSSTGLDFSGGKMNVTMNNVGDGVLVSPTNFFPMCAQFEDLSLDDFSIDSGVSFEAVFGDSSEGNSAALQLFHIANSTRVKVVETKNRVKTELFRTVEGINPDQVGKIQIDWVPLGGALDRILIEITTKTGEKKNYGGDGSIRSGLTHDPNKKTAYKIEGLNISVDPSVHVGVINLSDNHVPEPSAFAVFGLGTFWALMLTSHRRKK